MHNQQLLKPTERNKCGSIFYFHLQTLPQVQQGASWMWLGNYHANCTRRYLPVKTGKSFILLHPMQKGTLQPAMQKQCLGTTGDYGSWGKQRGCISQFIGKGPERVYAVIKTVRQIHSHIKPNCSHMLNWGNWRLVRHFFCYWVNVNDNQQRYLKGLKEQDWMSTRIGRFRLRKAKLEKKWQDFITERCEHGQQGKKF